MISLTAMKPESLHGTIWSLIFGGSLLLCLSWFVAPMDRALATFLAWPGGIGVAVGVVLIFVRSRMAPPGELPRTRPEKRS